MTLRCLELSETVGVHGVWTSVTFAYRAIQQSLSLFSFHPQVRSHGSKCPAEICPILAGAYVFPLLVVLVACLPAGRPLLSLTASSALRQCSFSFWSYVSCWLSHCSSRVRSNLSPPLFKIRIFCYLQLGSDHGFRRLFTGLRWVRTCYKDPS